MQILGLVWRERSSDSRFVESVWKCNAPIATPRVVIADPCISVSLEENKGKLQVVIIGPTVKPYRVSLAAGYTCTTIRLRLGCFLKDSLVRELMKHPIVLPADSEGRFWLKGICFRFLVLIRPSYLLMISISGDTWTRATRVKVIEHQVIGPILDTLDVSPDFRHTSFISCNVSTRPYGS